MTVTQAPKYSVYTNLVTEADLVEALRVQGDALVALILSIPEDEASKLHGKYTWTLREVIGHIIDAERVFSYRALRFARNDPTPLPGFDEMTFAKHGDYDKRDLSSLAEEFKLLRHSNAILFATLPKEAWQRTGIAADMQWTVTAVCKAMIGHARHHERIIRNRLAGVA